MEPPFEPLGIAELKFLTWKTCFLVTLASGQRRSEIHALVRSRVHHQTNWQSVSMQPSRDFLAKNQLASSSVISFQPVVIPSLSKTLGPDLEQDKTLCPVRALRYYLSRTESLLKGREKLFIAYKPGHTGEIVPATISSWLKQVIRFAYQQVKPGTLQTLQVSGHSVRATASSWAAIGGASVDQILHACHWRSHNTFTSFYLKDIAWEDAQNFTLGPFVAAQSIVQPQGPPSTSRV